MKFKVGAVIGFLESVFTSLGIKFYTTGDLLHTPKKHSGMILKVGINTLNFKLLRVSSSVSKRAKNGFVGVFNSELP